MGQIREYGTRFVAEVECESGDKKRGNPFGTLARYIGVFGDAQNEGATPMAMTAPVAMEKKGNKVGTPMSMTAPVAMEKNTDSGSDGGMRMKFFLPAEYDSLEKIPKPTNPDVKITKVPPQVGVVHRYAGRFTEALHDEKA